MVFLGLGLFFVGLGILGALLPLIPTTPFILLASYFFARSSPRMNQWLRTSRLFGPLIRDWQEKGGVRLSVKFTAIVVIPVVIGTSAYFGQLSFPLLTLLVLLGLIGLIVVIRLPVARDPEEEEILDPVQEET